MRTSCPERNAVAEACRLAQGALEERVWLKRPCWTAFAAVSRVREWNAVRAVRGCLKRGSGSVKAGIARSLMIGVARLLQLGLCMGVGDETGCAAKCQCRRLISHRGSILRCNHCEGEEALLSCFSFPFGRVSPIAAKQNCRRLSPIYFGCRWPLCQCHSPCPFFKPPKCPALNLQSTPL